MCRAFTIGMDSAEGLCRGQELQELRKIAHSDSKNAPSIWRVESCRLDRRGPGLVSCRAKESGWQVCHPTILPFPREHHPPTPPKGSFVELARRYRGSRKLRPGLKVTDGHVAASLPAFRFWVSGICLETSPPISPPIGHCFPSSACRTKESQLKYIPYPAGTRPSKPVRKSTFGEERAPKPCTLARAPEPR